MKPLKDGVVSHLGGVNLSVAQDLLREDELVRARNARSLRHGAARKRSGSQRLHTDILAGTPQGAVQWDPPSGSQEVIVSNGCLYYKLTSATTFSMVIAGLSTSSKVSFTIHRILGVPILYLTDGTNIKSWNGSVLGVVSSAPAVGTIEVYKSRMFGTGADKYLYFSVIDDPEGWSALNGAGQAPIETYDTEPLVGQRVVGGSLLLFKEDSISRFTGYSRKDIEIDTETDGVSSETGLYAASSLIRIEDVAFFLSDRGAYLATEASARYIGEPIELEMDGNWNRSALNGAVAVQNRRRREAWLFVPAKGSSTNDICWVYDYDHKVWFGPWDFPFSVAAACRYERADGTESVLLVGTDGIARDGDVDGVGALDDVLVAGTGGTKVAMELGYRQFTFGDPSLVKLCHLTQHVQADLGEKGELIISLETEEHDRELPPIRTKGVGLKDYRFRPACRGRRISFTLADYTDEIVEVNTLSLRAKPGRRNV